MSNSNQLNDHGIGIINFLKHKNYFIIGSTGFIAKVFVEKLLREVPEVDKIYLLIRAKDAEAAQQRLQSEMIDCKVFKRLKEQHGKRYEDFMRSKLVAVVGNLSQPCLGMDADMARLIREQTHVIINSAGNTKWSESYDVLLDVNVRGLSRLLGFAMGCKKLVLFLHVSTVSTSKPGIALEKPIISGNESALDVETELKMVTELTASSTPNVKLETEMSKLGMSRAKYHGYVHSYHLTKAMGEMLLTKLKGTVSTVIIRPSFVKSSIKDPFSGWIEGYRGMDPLILSYGKGRLTGILANPETIVDIVPVDMVANSMIAATANHGIIGKPGVYIYHLASSVANPITCHKLFEYSRKYFTKHPFKNFKVQEMEMYTSMSEYIMVGLETHSSSDIQHKKLVRTAAIYEPSMFATWRFDNKNTQILFNKMSLEEKRIFGFDVKSIDWEDYFLNIHIPGLRKHILKEEFIPSKL